MLQFHLDKQFRYASAVARAAGVILKVRLPT